MVFRSQWQLLQLVYDEFNNKAFAVLPNQIA